MSKASEFFNAMQAAKENLRAVGDTMQPFLAYGLGEETQIKVYLSVADRDVVIQLEDKSYEAVVHFAPEDCLELGYWLIDTFSEPVHAIGTKKGKAK